MGQASPARTQHGLRVRLTDCIAIAREVAAQQDAGHGEVAIWRHFMEAFIVDLDALSLIIAELFARSHGEVATQLPAMEPQSDYRQAA